LLTKLSIQNYALIEDVNVSFTNGLTTITGETGAGKSILLGGLGLILGNRSDTNTLMNANKKCVIEGEFEVSKYNLQAFFKQHDIDYDSHSVIRRELLPGGKSRAFVNDTPVRLEILTDLQTLLIDVHSQHQTLQLTEQTFQFNVIDALSDCNDMVSIFKKKKVEFEQKTSELDTFKEQLQKEKEQADYHYHLFRELELIQLKKGEFEELSIEQERLSHIELIQLNLNESYSLLSEEEVGINSKLYQIKNNLAKIKSYSKTYESFFQRFETVYIELLDLDRELSQIVEKEQYSPDDLEHINSRLLQYHQLMQKHRVQTEEQLLEIFNELSEKVKRISNSDENLKKMKEVLETLQINLSEIGHQIYEKRKKVLPTFEHEISYILHQLGMNEAVFKVQLEIAEKFNTHGINTMQWLFSANKGNNPGLVHKVASGGELSRIMLAIKSALAKKAKLPTIIFDEIDSGISGEIAVKMSEIMREMSREMQVICITHLPQIAAKGEIQLKVFKETLMDKTLTQIKKLTDNERLQEIAEMLGGKQLTETALKHAAELLQFKK